jgi:hypothetical protein
LREESRKEVIRVRYLFLWFLGVPGILVLLLWFTRALG